MPKRSGFKGRKFGNEEIKRTMQWLRKQGILSKLSRYEIRREYLPMGAKATPYQAASLAFGASVQKVLKRVLLKARIGKSEAREIRKILKAYADYFETAEQRTEFFDNLIQFAKRELEFLEEQKEAVKNSNLPKEAISLRVRHISRIQLVLNEIYYSAVRFKRFLEKEK